MNNSFRGYFTHSRVLVLCVVIFVLTALHLVQLFHSDNSIKSPSVGGIYKEGVVGSLRSPNPLFAGASSIDEDIVSLVYSGLTKYDPKQKKIVPDLATFQVSENKKEYTFYINPNAEWHDGTKVTSEDILYTYALIQNKDFSNALLKNRFVDVKLEKIDETTVKFILPKPYYFFPTATTVGILPQHIWKDIPIAEIAQSALNFTPVGTGPFESDKNGIIQMQNGTDAQLVTLKRNNDFYGEKPYLEEVILEIFSDFDALKAQKDALEGIKDIPPTELTAMRSGERFQIHEIASPRYFAVFLNMDKEPIKNWRTRFALQVAISRDEIMQKYSFLKPVNTPFLQQQETSWTNEYSLQRARGSLFDAGWKFPSEEQVRQKEEELIQRVGTGALLSDNDTSTGALLKNLTLSGARLEEIVEDYKKVRFNEKGEWLTLKLVVISNPEYLKDMAEMITRQWEMVGVNVKLDVREPRDIPSVIASRDYDAILIGQELGYDQDIFSYWHSSKATKRGYNLSNFKNSNADILIEEMRSPNGSFSEDQAEEYISQHMKDLTKIFTDEIPAIFLFQPTAYAAIDKKFNEVFWQNLVFPQDRFETITRWHLTSQETLRIPFTTENFFSWIKKYI